jgi:hypothetical protein
MTMNADDLCKAVMELELSPIKAKLMHVKSGEGWSQEKVDAVEKEYRRFLCLMKLYPDESTAPLVDVDTFWHYHILDTMKYAVDCEQVFGYFLHHYPYVGMRGEEDEQFRIDSGERMRTLYEATFGGTYPGSDAKTSVDAATAFCGGPDAAIKAATAYCGGPDAAIKAAPAYCGGPDAAIKASTAFCGGPDAVIKASTAFCAGPDAAIKASTAFCAGPDKAIKAATA